MAYPLSRLEHLEVKRISSEFSIDGGEGVAGGHRVVEGPPQGDQTWKGEGVLVCPVT